MNAKAVNRKALKLARKIDEIGRQPFSGQNMLKYSAHQRELLQLCIDALEAGLRFAEEKE